MNTHRCAVVAGSEATRQLLAAYLEARGLCAVGMATLAELPATLASLPVSGILVELTASITASPLDKKAAQELIEFYPSAKFRVTNQQVLIVGETLNDFLERCLRFEARLTRKAVRADRFLAVYLSAGETCLNPEKAVTLNISASGCSLMSTRDWAIGDRVNLRFLDSGSSVCGTVRSFRPWGNNRHLPGIGIQFDPSPSSP
jgi:hypothetical protein